MAITRKILIGTTVLGAAAAGFLAAGPIGAGLAGLTTGAAAVLGIGRRPPRRTASFRAADAGHGLLTPRTRPPLTDGERARLLDVHLGYARAAKAAAEARSQTSDRDLTPLEITARTATALTRRWRTARREANAALTDDELRTLQKLWTFAEPEGPMGPDAAVQTCLDDVADPAILRETRTRVKQWHLTRGSLGGPRPASPEGRTGPSHR